MGVILAAPPFAAMGGLHQRALHGVLSAVQVAALRARWVEEGMRVAAHRHLAAQA